MNPEQMNAELRAIEQRHQQLSASELDTVLTRLNELASSVEDLPPGDAQSTLASITELRRRFTDRYNVAVADGTG
ncbi:hypothetical protein GIS00_11940 [Nakamurella sp. YIM 132087]|uniref:Uncharacterized protein n=1 Tax=Nakamurella alba TaxID=2665158 RepID=A0A7K1FPB1_9ACTN|nr:hypothetical protein [Nakamurella alba]MTD14654.1 hypothetical protein [Nakamurella alba]